MDNLVSMAPPPDPNQAQNPLSMLGDISKTLDPKTKKILQQNKDNPDFISRVGELAPQIKDGLAAQNATPIQPPGAAGAPSALPPVPPPMRGPVPKIQTRNQQNTDAKSATGTKTNAYDTDTLDQIGQWTRNQPEYQEQKQAADQIQNMLRMSAAGQANTGWIKPLSALSDSVTGSQLSASAPSADARNATLLKYADEAAKRKADMMKTIMEGASKLKTGQDSQNQIQDLKNLVMRGTGEGGSLGGGLNNRTIATQATAAGQQYDKEPMLRALEGSFNNFDKFQGLIDGKTPITSSVFNNLQEELTRATRGAQSGGAIADSAVIRDQMNPIAAAWNKIETNITSKGQIPDMRRDAPALFTQLQSLKDQLRQDFENQYAQRVEQLRHNFDASSELLGAPQIAAASHNKADQLLKARITKGKPLAEAVAPGGAPAPLPSGAPKVGDVMDGHQFLGGNPADPKSWKAM